MSNTVGVAEATSPGVSGVIHSWIAAAEHAAAVGYHSVVAIEADVASWEAGHPEIQPILAAGVKYASGLLAAAGLPVPEMINDGRMIMAGWKKLAALDASVVSGTGEVVG